MKTLILISPFIWMLLSATPLPHQISQPTDERIKVVDEEPEYDYWGYIAAGAGILGLLLITLPYVSIIGLILGAGALVTGIFFRKRIKRRKWLATVGIVAGALCLGLFSAVVGLVLFF